MTAQNAPSLLMQALATRIGFLIAGLGLSVWAPMVPFVRQRIVMNDATFGLLLLSIGLGSLCCMPLTARLASHLGIRRTATLSMLLLLIALAGIAFGQTVPTMMLALFCFGGSMGVLDIVLNIQGLAVENHASKRMMSNFHGMFSLGTIVGALFVSLLLMAGLAPSHSLLLAMGLMVALFVFAQRGFLAERTRSESSGWRWPGRWILLVGLLCFVVYLAEGAILDWGALYLLQYSELPVARTGLGYVAFASAVTLGRFFGDALSNLLGTVRILALGGLLAAAGIALGLFFPHWSTTLAGYALCGLGCANISPVAISSLGRQSRMPAHQAVTIATTIGFSGVLAGPALIGAVAQHSSLVHAFAMVAAGLMFIALISPALRRAPE